MRVFLAVFLLLFSSLVFATTTAQQAYQSCQVAITGLGCAIQCLSDSAGRSMWVLANYAGGCAAGVYGYDGPAVSVASVDTAQNAACNQDATIVDTSVTAVSGGAPTATRGGKTAPVDLKKVAFAVGVGVSSGAAVGGVPGAVIGGVATVLASAAAAALTDPPVVNQTCNIVLQNSAGVQYAPTVSQVVSALQQATPAQLQTVLQSMPQPVYDCVTGANCIISSLCSTSQTFTNGACVDASTTSGTGTSGTSSGTGTSGTSSGTGTSSTCLTGATMFNNACVCTSTNAAPVNGSCSTSTCPTGATMFNNACVCTSTNAAPVNGSCITSNSDFCASQPDYLGCLASGSSSAVDIHTYAVLPNFSSPLSDGGSTVCPAPLSLVTRYYTGSFSFSPACQFFAAIRPVVLAVFSMVSAAILLPAVRG